MAQAAVADVGEPGERARLFGLLGAAFGLGFVAGPAIGALAALGGARLPFLVAAALAGVNAVVAVRRLPETNARTAAPAVELPPLGVAFGALVAFRAFEATFALVRASAASTSGPRRRAPSSPWWGWCSSSCRACSACSSPPAGWPRVVGPLAGGLAFEHLGVPSPYLLGAAVMVVCALLVPR